MPCISLLNRDLELRQLVVARFTNSQVARLPPIAVALAGQIAAVLLVLAAVRVFRWPVSIWVAAAFAGATAALLAKLLRLEKWWIAIQLVFPLLLVAMLRLGWPAWIYFAILVLLALVYWSAFRSRVPLYLSNHATWRAVEKLLPDAGPGRRLKFIDLGSGLGGLLSYLGARRPDIDFDGIELAPLPALLSRLRLALTGRRNVRIHWGSFWPHQLANYDVVFAFLSPVPMPELWAKVRQEMRPGALFVSCAFEVPGQTPDQVIELDSARQPRLLVWRVGERTV